MAMLALTASSFACTEPEAVVVDTVIDLGETVICSISPTGLVLQPGEVSQLSADGSLAALVELESRGQCGLIAQDAATGTFWVAEGWPWSFEPEMPSRLIQFDAAGNLQWERELGPAGSGAYATALLVKDGEAFVGIAHTNTDLNVAKLQRYDESGEVVWTQVGYQGVNGEERPMTSLSALVASDAGLTMLGYTTGIDSSSVTVFTVSPQDGEPLWTTSLTGDDFWGQDYDLASDGAERLFLAAKQPAWAEFDPDTFEVTKRHPARARVEALTSTGASMWASELELPDIDEPSDFALALFGGHLYTGAFDRPYAESDDPQSWIVRHDDGGAHEGTTDLDIDGFWGFKSMTPLGDRSLALVVEVVVSFEAFNPTTKDVIYLLRAAE